MSLFFNGSFKDFVSSQFLPTYKQVYFNTVPMLRYTEPIMEAFSNETQFWGDKVTKYDNSTLVVYSLDPFEPDILTHGGPSASPPNRSLAVLPASIEIQDGRNLTDAAPYVNYAFLGTPMESMCGDNLERLRETRRRYDPEDVMGLAGGWKF